VDAEQCYDAVNHAATSVGLQACLVPINFILVYPQAMAEMQFHLRTGFGRDSEGFKGTALALISVVWVKGVVELVHQRCRLAVP
jgi:hypothetical protein